MIKPKKRTSFFLYLTVAIVSSWQLLTMKPPDVSTAAQDPIKTCIGLNVKSIALAKLRESNHKPEKAKIFLPEATTSDNTNKTLNVVAIGPVLGSMDLSEFRTDLDCTPQGFILTTTITRSANFNGAVAKNINWHPRMETTVELFQPEIVVETKWIMRSSTGALIAQAKTPPFGESENYPIIVRKTIKKHRPIAPNL